MSSLQKIPVILDSIPTDQPQVHLLDHPTININLQQSKIQTLKQTLPITQKQTSPENPTKDASFIGTGQLNVPQNQSSSFRQKIICQICDFQLEERRLHQIFNCTHKYCKICLESYLLQKFYSFQMPFCPDESCLEVLLNQDSQFFKKRSSRFANLYNKIKRFHTISKEKNLKFCPKQECQGFVKLQETPETQRVTETKEVDKPDFTNKKGKCQKCDLTYCWECMMKYHENECEQNRVQHLQQNLKYRQCSTCKIIVQRSQGCPHITCVCRNEFCYYCGEKWQLNHLRSCPKKPENQEHIGVFNAEMHIENYLERQNVVQNEQNGPALPENQNENKLTSETFLPYKLNDFLKDTVPKMMQKIQPIPNLLRCFLLAFLLILYLPAWLIALNIDIMMMTIGFAMWCGKRSKNMLVAFMMMVFLPFTFILGLVIGLTRKKRYILYKKAFNEAIDCRELHVIGGQDAFPQFPQV